MKRFRGRQNYIMRLLNSHRRRNSMKVLIYKKYNKKCDKILHYYAMDLRDIADIEEVCNCEIVKRYNN